MLAAAISAVLAALIPRDYVFIAILGTLPIWVIGLVAGWRQLMIPSDARRNAVLQTAQSQSWQEFASSVDDAWRILGIHANRCEDAGADWRIAQESVYTLVHAKRWKASVHGLEPLRQLAQAMEQQGIAKGLYIAVGGEVSPPAQRFARDNNISIWLGDELSLFLLGKLPPDR